MNLKEFIIDVGIINERYIHEIFHEYDDQLYPDHWERVLCKDTRHNKVLLSFCIATTYPDGIHEISEREPLIDFFLARKLNRFYAIRFYQ